MSRDPIMHEKALCVESIISVHGYVKDEKGNNLEGATVTMKNLNTSDVLEMNANQSGFSFDIVFPRWMQAGDTIELNATFGNRVGGVAFGVPSSTLDMSFDIVIDMREAGSWLRWAARRDCSTWLRISAKAGT